MGSVYPWLSGEERPWRRRSHAGKFERVGSLDLGPRAASVLDRNNAFHVPVSEPANGCIARGGNQALISARISRCQRNYGARDSKKINT